jgi:hypothetical protein
MKNLKLVYEHNIKDPICGEPFKFAVINNKFYIERYDVLKRPYWKNLDKITNEDYRSDCKTSIAWYLYTNYKNPEILDELWKLKFDGDNVPFYQYGMWTHLEHLRDQYYDKTELTFPNKTKESLLLLKDSIEKRLRRRAHAELDDEDICCKTILQEVNKRLES